MVLSVSSPSLSALPDSLGLQHVQGQQHLLAGAVALISAVLTLSFLYVFQPALAAWRRPQDHEPHTFVKYAPNSSSSSSSSSSDSDSPARNTRATRRATVAEEEEERFPTLADPPTVLLSLVIPAYNEEVRLPVMLDATLAYLEEWKKRSSKNGSGSSSSSSSLTYELIVVDDGSTDRTVEVASRYSRILGSDVLRVLKLRTNRGKGGAIKEGMLHSRGEYALMVDADGATDITCLERMLVRTQGVEEGMEGGSMGIGVGSRAHYEKDSVATRAWYRTILMKGLHMLVTVLISGRIKDTQCGFKLFSRAANKILFGTLHLERWGFDLEIVHVCDRLGLPMVEVAVNWQEVEGSKLITNKLDVVLASVGIFRDMLCVRLCYLLGVWKTTPWTKEGLKVSGGGGREGGRRRRKVE